MAFLTSDLFQKHSIPIVVIGFEAVSIFVILIATLVLKSIAILKQKNTDIIRGKIERFLLNLMENDKYISKKNFPESYRNLSLLVPIIIKFDSEKNNKFLVLIRNQLMREVVLPLARESIKNKDTRSMILSSEAFCLMEERNVEDEQAIIELLKSRIPFVVLNGVKSGVYFGSEATVKAVISKFSDESWLLQSASLKLFKDVSVFPLDIIKEHLLETRNPKIRAVCYEILIQYPGNDLKDIFVEEDVRSNNLELRLSSLKFIAHTNKKVAIPFLIEGLKDQSWEVRLVSVHRLSLLHATEALDDLLKMLEDPEWWVQLSAAKALNNFGLKGQDALKAVHRDFDKISIEHPHITNTWW